MTRTEFAEARILFDEEASSVLFSKMSEYAPDTDVLANFKKTAERLGITPMQAWAVFILKHMESVMTYARTGRTFCQETFRSRLLDIRNFADLGVALAQETHG